MNDATTCFHCGGDALTGCECEPLYLCPGCELMGARTCDLCCGEGLVSEGDLAGVARALEGRGLGEAAAIVDEAEGLGDWAEPTRPGTADASAWWARLDAAASEYLPLAANPRGGDFGDEPTRVMA